MKKSLHLSLRVSQDMKLALKTHAQRQGRTMGSLCVNILEQWLKKRTPPRP